MEFRGGTALPADAAHLDERYGTRDRAEFLLVAVVTVVIVLVVGICGGGATTCAA